MILIEAICEQIKRCLGNIKVLAVTKDSRHLLELEIQHLDLLLEFLQSNIDIVSYLQKYHTLFPAEKWHIYLDGYISQLSFFESEQNNITTVDKDAYPFIKILQICSNNLKSHLHCGKYESIRDEVYYNHNLPSLIISKNKDLIKYYITIECTGYKSYCAKEMTYAYEPIWKQISEEYLEK